MLENIHSIMLVFSTALGAFMLWAKWSQKRSKVFILADVIELFCEKDSQTARQLEFIVFIALGCFVGIVMVEPATIRQAFAAGLGWTSFCINTKKI